MKLKVGNWYLVYHNEDYKEIGSTTKKEFGTYYYGELRADKCNPSAFKNFLLFRTIDDKFIMYASSNKLTNIDIKSYRDCVINEILGSEESFD